MYNEQSERSILSSILYNPNLMNTTFVNTEPEHFFDKSHEEIFRAIRKLHNINEPIDVVTVSAILEHDNKLEQIGGRAYINDIAMEEFSTVTAPFHKNILEENFMLRRIQDISKEISECTKSGIKSNDLIADYMNKLYNLSLRSEDEDCISLLENPQYFLEETHKAEEEPPEIFQTLYPAIDEKVTFCRGDFLVVGGGTSMGKSLMTSCLELAGYYQNIPVITFSLEMNKKERLNRLYANVCDIELDKFKKGGFTQRDIEDISTVTDKIFSNFDLTIYDRPGIDTDYIYQKLLIEKKKRGKLGLVIVDHMHLMRGKGRSEKEQLTQIAEALKYMARELDCYIIGVSQLKRKEGIDKEGNSVLYKPTIHDCKESGDIENIANIILLLHRDSRDSSLATVIIGKNRDGALGEVYLQFIGKYCKFVSMKGSQF